MYELSCIQWRIHYVVEIHVLSLIIGARVVLQFGLVPRPCYDDVGMLRVIRVLVLFYYHYCVEY